MIEAFYCNRDVSNKGSSVFIKKELEGYYFSWRPKDYWDKGTGTQYHDSTYESLIDWYKNNNFIKVLEYD